MMVVMMMGVGRKEKWVVVECNREVFGLSRSGWTREMKPCEDKKKQKTGHTHIHTELLSVTNPLSL